MGHLRVSGPLPTVSFLPLLFSLDLCTPSMSFFPFFCFNPFVGACLVDGLPPIFSCPADHVDCADRLYGVGCKCEIVEGL